MPPSSDLGKFLNKAIVFLVVLILLPLFPSSAPEFANRSLLSRGWELLHLLLVGIAVCYGLFSRRNDDVIEKEIGSSSKLGVENPQSYVTRFLEVPSVFDDEVETLDRCDEGCRVQSWSSKYSRGEPVAVVAVSESGGKAVRSARAKPLLLPVRSLKSRVLYSEAGEDGPLLGRPNSSRGSSEGGEDNVVLRSPIPWRSRSGRIEMREDVEAEGLDRPKVSDENGFRAVTNSLSPSGYTHLVSPEEGLMRMSIYKSPPPPAPPLPPPAYHKSQLMHSRSPEKGAEKEFRGMVSEKDSTNRPSVRDEMMRRLNSPSSRPNLEKFLIARKSVRTARTSDSLAGLKALNDVQDAGDAKQWKDVMEAPKEHVGRMPSKDITAPPLVTFSNAKKEEKEAPENIVTLESDYDSESEVEDDEEEEEKDKVSYTLNSCIGEKLQTGKLGMQDCGPDVDKKADEFIAKFRKQIRLQRIESIKRSANQAT